MQAFRLPSVFRRLFLLCDIQGFTVAEAAVILGISLAAVTKRLDRARREINVRLAVPEVKDPDRQSPPENGSGLCL